MQKPNKKTSKKKSITAEDLYRLRVPTSVSISPDEKQVAYTVERMNEKKKKYFANIYLLNIASKKSSQFTFGDHSDSQAVWSPDGSQIVFVSTRNKKTGIYLMPTKGGAEKKIIELDGAISRLQWTPDGRTLVFALRYNDSHYVKDKKEKKKEPLFRHITNLFYRMDDEGYVPKDVFHIYTLDIASAKLNQITKGKTDEYWPAVSPDGKQIAYVSNRAKNPHYNYLFHDLFMRPIKGGKEKKLLTPAGPISAPKFSPDGKCIAYIGHDNPDDAWSITNEHIWLVSLSSKQKTKDLLKTFDRMTYDQSITDSSDVHETAVLYWSGDSKRIYFLSSDTGNTNLFYVPKSGGRPTRVYRGKCHLKGLSLNGKGHSVALVYADISNPGDIITCPATYAAEKKAIKHTDLNKFLRTEVQLGKTTDVMFKSFDGTELQGWLLRPPKFNSNKKYPAILQIHGGPRVQYAHTFFHEMQYLAAKGYVIFYTNPRGGAGRGETWAESICGGWGDLDYKDCLAAADYMENLTFINSKKIGVTGGSYGGFMTNWIIGHTNRFKAAVTQRSICDLNSFIGSSDIGYDIEREFDGFPWTNPENYEKRSPKTYFKKVKTPVLIIHSEQDLRCPIEQAHQMYVMLKLLKKKVELVIFPEEPHGLSRHGRPDRRIARLGWIAKWFDKYMK